MEREIANNVKRLLEKLEATPCEDGTSLLDNTVVLFKKVGAETVVMRAVLFVCCTT